MNARASGWAAALALLFAAAPASANPGVFSIDAMQRVVDLSDAAIAPDGSQIALVTSQADLAHNAYRDRLWTYDLKARRLRLVDSARSSYAAPAWAPAGGSLAVIAGDAATHADQLFLIASGGKIRRLTSASTDVEAFAWRPDGAVIAFVRREETPVRRGSAAYEDAFEVTDNDYLATDAPRPSHLWTVDLRTGVQRRLTRGTWSVADDTISWSPDGRRLSYLRAPNAIHGVDDRTAAFVLDVATGTSQALTPHSDYEDQPLFSPDGSRTLYLYPSDGNPAGALTAMTVDAGDRNDRDAARDLDRHVEDATWMPDGALLLKVYDVTAGPLYIQPLDGPARRVPLGDVVDAQIGTQAAARNGTIAFVGTPADRPNELYASLPGAPQPQRLTNFNAAAAQLRLGNVTTVRWDSPEGFHEAGVLTFPPGYVAGRQYPLVLRIHGGPTETSEAFFEPFYQLAAAHGYLVFAPNYRGSSNLGNAFESAIFNDASVGPGKDVMAGVEAVERLGIVDSTRICVSGWSYGGQLTSWMIGHYQVWKCAVTGAAVNDLVVDYTIADDIDAARLAFDDSPFVGNELPAWQRQSPITYFKDIRTPLLMLGNVYDVRVPIVEQYEMYHALRDNGVPVRFFAYPSAGHLPRGPVRLGDAYRRWLAWFDRYLKG
ncbi:MAG TPA: prolyl oligopeptidase family serine peptidase [Candidatus Tumulicola sp.]|jgi:dipeptidyl aminopeptidase/acylaminoacyl peptidase